MLNCADLEDADADVVEVGRVRDEGRPRASVVSDTAWSRLLPSFSQSSPSVVFTPFMKRPLIQPSTASLSPVGGLPRVADDEAHRVDDDDAHLAEDARLHLLAGERIEHVADRAAEGDAAHRRGLHEVDLGDEDLPAREVRDELVEERDVLRLERDAARAGSTPTTRPSLKNTAHSSLSTVSCEYIGKFWSGCL